MSDDPPSSPASCPWIAGTRSSASRTSHNAPVLERLVAEVTVTDPRHALYGRRLAVLSLWASRGPEWISVALPDGRRRSIHRAATDLARPWPGDCRRPLVSVRTLLPLAHLVRDLLRISRGENPHGCCRTSVDQIASPDLDASDLHLAPRAPIVAGTAISDASAARPGTGAAPQPDAGTDPDSRGTGHGGDPC